MRPKTVARLPPSQLCRRLDEMPQNYFNWAAAGLLTEADPGGLSLPEAIELAVFVSLVRRLKLRRLKPMWGDVRKELRQRVLGTPSFVIYDEESSSLHLADRFEDIGRAVSHGGIVRVIPVDPLVDRVRTAFRAMPNAGVPRKNRTPRLVSRVGDEGLVPGV